MYTFVKNKLLQKLPETFTSFISRTFCRQQALLIEFLTFRGKQ